MSIPSATAHGAPAQPVFDIIEANTPELFQQCIDVRIKVFVDEQGYSAKEEPDNMDPQCAHFLLVERSSGTPLPVGTVRVYLPKWKLGRLAVLPLYRKYKLGAQLVKRVEEFAVKTAKEEGKKEAVILCHSQEYVVGFYKKLGYEPFGGIYQEENTPHQKMVLTVPVN